MYNESSRNSNFPNSLKLADVAPVYKKDDRTKKDKYRPVSILPPVSKIFEKNMFNQISSYIDKFLSPYLCAFQKGYSTQHCLALMIDRWQKAMDFLPHIIQPTRLITNTSTVIDNIYSNNIQDGVISGNILLTLSEHFSQFISVKRERIDIKKG